MSKSKKHTAVASATGEKTLAWQDLKGFDVIYKRIGLLVQTQQFPAVSLFDGRAGIGKKTLLMKIAGLFCCERHPAKNSVREGDGGAFVEACGVCSSCLLLLAGRHPDLLLIESQGKSLKVEDIADIQDHLSLYPSHSQKRLAIIVDAELLTLQAVNKLLKILEEPPASSLILLSTSAYTQLLPTLLSRCVHFKLPSPSLADNHAIVQKYFQSHGINCPLHEEELTALILRFGQAPGQVLAALQEDSSLRQMMDLCKKLVQAPSISSALSLAEELSAIEEGRLIEIVHEFEFALNRFYKQSLVEASQDAESSQNLRAQIFGVKARRALISQLKHVAGKQKVTLNTQLAMESLGLSCLGSPI